MNFDTQRIVMRCEAITGSLKSVDGDERSFDAVLSTPAVDRYGEVVLPSAYEASLRRIERSGASLPMLYQHDHDDPIGTWSRLWVDDAGLHGRMLFDEDDEALTKRDKVRSGSIPAVSVGFLADPRKVESRTLTLDGEQRRVPHYTEVDLIEASLVTVPANREALIQRATSVSGASLKDVTVAWGDPGELAELLGWAKDNLGGLEDRIEQSVVQTIKTELSAEPGGRVHHLIREAVAVVRSQGLNEAPTDGFTTHAREETLRFLEQARDALAKGRVRPERH